MDKSSIAALKALAPKIVDGQIPYFSEVTVQKAAHIVRYLKVNPGSHTAAELGKVVGWGAQHTRVVLGALGLRGGRKGYEWKVEQKEEV